MIDVSVVITCYNLEHHITRAISSCLNQTVSEDRCEIIVVDDCSTDASWRRINEFGKLICPFRHDTNLGVAAASNTGLQQARGKYVIRVDGDDYINRNMVLTLSEVLRWNKDIPFVWCDHIEVDDAGERVHRINTLERLLENGAGVMFRMNSLAQIGFYNETLRNCEDYELIKRYIDAFGEGTRIPLPYYRRFRRDGSLSTRVDEREQLKRELDERYAAD